MSRQQSQILDAAAMQECLERIASQVIDSCDPAVPLALVGIRSGGMPLARRLAAIIGESKGTVPSVGAIDITLYRDDLYTGLEKPSLGETSLPIDISGAGVVLVDDVLFTGRTVRAALGELHDYGRPCWIRLAVLVDRGHRELPIQADFTGCTIESSRSDRVVVVAGESAGEDDGVFVESGLS